jgi:hypothetical protein
LGTRLRECTLRGTFACEKQKPPPPYRWKGQGSKNTSLSLRRTLARCLQAVCHFSLRVLAFISIDFFDASGRSKGTYPQTLSAFLILLYSFPSVHVDDGLVFPVYDKRVWVGSLVSQLSTYAAGGFPITCIICPLAQSAEKMNGDEHKMAPFTNWDMLYLYIWGGD